MLKDGRAWGGTGIGILASFTIGLLATGRPWGLQAAWGDLATWITAIATIGLLAGAIVTAVYVIRTFRAQTQEISDQADMLNIQSDRLEPQERQFEDQPKINQKCDELFDKQLRESEQLARTLERQQAEAIDLKPGLPMRPVPATTSSYTEESTTLVSPMSRGARSGTSRPGSGLHQAPISRKRASQVCISPCQGSLAHAA